MKLADLRVHSSACGLIYDLDGTLVDTMPLHFKAWRYALKTYSIDFGEQEFYAYAGLPTHVIMETLRRRHGIPFAEEEIMHRKDEFFIDSIDDVEIIESVFSLVREWFGRLPQGIGTGGRREIVDKTLYKLGIRKYFDVIVTVEDVIHPKPHPETFVRCAEVMGVDPEFCQVFEDGDNGLQAARDAGMIPTDVRPFIASREGDVHSC